MNLGLKALACLLLYPDAALKDNLQEIKEALQNRHLLTIRRRLSRFLSIT